MVSCVKYLDFELLTSCLNEIRVSLLRQQWVRQFSQEQLQQGARYVDIVIERLRVGKIDRERI
jgi:hypothetical protein